MHTNTHIQPFRVKCKKSPAQPGTIHLGEFTACLLEATKELRHYGIVDPKLVGASTHRGIVTLSIRHFSLLDDIAEAELGGFAVEKTRHGEQAHSYWTLALGRQCRVTWRKPESLDAFAARGKP